MPVTRAVLVTHTHWDREWYRTFEDFRSRLVDAVDHLLDLCKEDSGYRFLLDGQTIVLEDYAEIRPARREELAGRIEEGRIAIGPWYVQPDSLLPHGETHVRNLLEGRRVGETFGPVSRAGYTPDSFGHPAQFPQLFAGFGIETFLYWRGHGSELDRLPAEYRWVAPDGSGVLACNLRSGYFNAQTAPGASIDDAARNIARVMKTLGEATRSDRLLLLNGVDHALPETRTRALAEALSKETGIQVDRGLLEDFIGSGADALTRHDALDLDDARHEGELVGGRTAPLLPGVWSARTWIKLRNRRCEARLLGWAEPWCALAAQLGHEDESASLSASWRHLLPNQAHDSICGCSRDRVHRQMMPRYDASEELAERTTARVLDRLAGLGRERRTPWEAAFDLAVFNPSPHPRSDVVRYRFDPHPYIVPGGGRDPGDWIHPLVLREMQGARYRVDGEPARFAATEETGRVALIPDRPAWDLEFPVADVPAFGWKRVRVTCEPPEPGTAATPDEEVDGGREIAAPGVRVRANDDGTFDVEFAGRRFPGLGALEDRGDRGDTYDHDIVAAAPADVEELAPRFERRRHASGIQRLRIERRLRVPAALAADRTARSSERVELPVTLELRVAPGAARVDLKLHLTNTAEDHRLRLRFPLPEPVERFAAATTFDVAERTPGPCDDEGWIHPATPTFQHQGFVRAGGLTVVAPGLCEGEVEASGAIAITVLRAVGHLSRHDLRTRPGPAGPGIATPEAQCTGPLEASLSLLADGEARAALDAELGLEAVPCGDAPLLEPDTSLLSLEPAGVVLSTLKPALDGRGVVLRVSNPTGEAVEATVRLGLPFEGAESVRLDEEPDGETLAWDGRTLRLQLAAHGLRSVRLT